MESLQLTLEGCGMWSHDTKYRKMRGLTVKAFLLIQK